MEIKDSNQVKTPQAEDLEEGKESVSQIMEERHDRRRSSEDTAPDFAARTPVIPSGEFTGKKSNKVQQLPQKNHLDQTVQ